MGCTNMLHSSSQFPLTVSLDDDRPYMLVFRRGDNDFTICLRDRAELLRFCSGMDTLLRIAVERETAAQTAEQIDETVADLHDKDKSHTGESGC